MTSRREPRPALLHAPDVYGFAKTIENTLPWSHAVQQLEAAHNYWLVTVRPDGRPHATPVWGVWVDDAFYFDGLPTTQWGRNLSANPAMTVHLESGEDVVILEGMAEDLNTDAHTAGRIVAAWNEKYGRLAPEPDTRGIVRLRPRTARGWSSSSLGDGTRWTFDDE